MGLVDDSEKTLELLRRWDIPPSPPEKITNRNFVGECCRPTRIQLAKSDVDGESLLLTMSLAKKEFLEKSGNPVGNEGDRILLYGPDGKVHQVEMLMEDSPVSMKGWRKFVKDYDLKEICDFVTTWMFRHAKTNEICFAIDVTRLSLRKQLSERILKAVFENRD